MTFDSSTPFLIAGRYQRAYADIANLPRKIHLAGCPMPDHPRYIGSDLPWPCSSPFADRLTLGDLCVKSSGKTSWDSLSQTLLAAHNVWQLCHAVAQVNRRLRLTQAESRLWLPERLIDLTIKIREVLRSETPMTLIQRWTVDLDHLASLARDSTLLPEDTDR